VESSVLPSESEEVWRYTPIDDLDLGEFVPVTSSPGDAARGRPDRHRNDAREPRPAVGQVVVHNGFPLSFDAQGGARRRRPVPPSAAPADVPGAQSMVGSVQVGGDALVRLNDAFAPDAVLVDVPAGVEVPDPILIVHWCDGGQAAATGRPSFPAPSSVLGDRARAAVVEVFVGPIGSRAVARGAGHRAVGR
jgi:hypothetical protein